MITFEWWQLLGIIVVVLWFGYMLGGLAAEKWPRKGGKVKEMQDMTEEERQALIQEGRNQVLYLLLSLGDENVAHDNWHPDRARVLVQARQEIVKRLKCPRPNGVKNTVWPPLLADGTRDWPNFETYLCIAG